MPIGDVCWIDFPSSGGHEQAGRRPSVILQDESYASRSPLVYTVPLTTASSTLTRFPAVISLPADQQNGLIQDSYILVFQLRAVDRTRVRNCIGNVGDVILGRIFEALDQMMGRIQPQTDSTSTDKP